MNLTLLGRAVVVAGCVAASRGADAPGPTLTLDPVQVVSVPDYKPLETGWQVSDVPGFRIFSHGNAAAKTVADQLQLTRAAFGLVWNDEALMRRPLTVVVTADEAEFLAWAKVPATAMDRTVSGVATPSGPVMLVNGGLENVQRATGRGYVLAQLQDTKLPRWFQEGIAQVANSAEAVGDRLQIGRVQQDPRNSVSLDTIREMRSQIAFSVPGGVSRLEPVTGIKNRRGEEVEVRINGLTPTIDELERHLNDEALRRAEENYVYNPDTDFLNFLNDGVVMSLAKILSPDASDSVRWRMNAWGFTHYSLFAHKQQHRDAFLKFVRQLEREPGRNPVELAEQAYGASAGKIELNLALYARSGTYAAFDYKLAEPFRAVKAALENVPEANVVQLRARVYSATGRTEEARQLLAHGYANPANRTAAYLSQFVALERAHDPERAAQLLEEAARREQLDNPGRRMLADARLTRLQRNGARLSENDLRMVLLPLFAALNQGDQSEELFVLIGKAWAASAIAPKPEHLNALRLGLTYHPQSRELAELLQRLEQHS